MRRNVVVPTKAPTKGPPRKGPTEQAKIPAAKAPPPNRATTKGAPQAKGAAKEEAARLGSFIGHFSRQAMPVSAILPESAAVSTATEKTVEDSPVAVALRVRPLSGAEISKGSECCLKLVGSTVTFDGIVHAYDYCFGQDSTQLEVVPVATAFHSVLTPHHNIW